MQQPLVSIITITRNRSNFISRAIESILNQTYTNIEYIIVDGASTDNTKEIIESYDDQRIKYIRLSKNCPVVDSIKIGFENSTGDYITFLDDDDEYLNTKIEKQLNLISALPEKYGFVYCWMDYYDQKTNQYLYTHKSELKGYVASDVIDKPKISGTPSYFFRRKAFQSLKGWRDDIGIISDWELAVRACQLFYVDFVPESLVKVYIHEKSRMSDISYYNDYYNRNIIFHKTFLNEYKYFFNKEPYKKKYHLYDISYSFFMMNKWKEGYPYYRELLKVSKSYKSILLPINCFLKQKLRLS